MTESTTQGRLTLHEVAERLGVHYMTAYRYVRLGMLHAEKDGRSWYVTTEDLERFTESDKVVEARGSARWDERYYRRLLAMDGPGAWSVVEAAMAAGTTVLDVYTSILVPALRRIGAAWERGEIGVADEHGATLIVQRTISRLGPLLATRGLRRGLIILGSTQTEQHSLPMTIVGDMLRAQRFEVHDLGANLPPEAFAAFVTAVPHAMAIGISVTTPGQDDELQATIDALRAVSDAPIFVGGHGIDQHSAVAAIADAYVDSPDEVVELLEARAG